MLKSIIPVAFVLLPTFAFACQTLTSVSHTFYGFPDNDPPGAGTAYNCGGRNYIAGGTGTFSDPVTFASAPGEFAQCEIIYDPYLQKYLRMEDTCAQCTTDWSGGSGFVHIDVWSGSSTTNGGDTQIACENELTPAERSQSIVRTPDASFPVDSEC
jgi:hypothetical protein